VNQRSLDQALGVLIKVLGEARAFVLVAAVIYAHNR